MKTSPVLGGLEFKVPHHSKFADWAKYPEVAQHEARLNRLNLSDPWKRNYAWGFSRVDQEVEILTSRKPPVPIILKSIFYPLKSGVVPGLCLAGAIIACDELYSLAKHGHTSWGAHGHGDDHADGHH